ncbi:sugar phosphate isomerase/epimerase family protein [Priestia endophytica]|jgi:sugar phosphate isomerase/epimerase|uniref:sugar phosphate isomerase/epimerase family protein n=1 Tax=Priestia endophytica TaxID=135735 RepID=UPI00203DD1BC|nr:sugar phosphate isomerase/epimerase family protein [Priestia endophytica]MCM3537382.1 sugar phosphate isomerase/epimerase [Priestia endophytica]
MNLGIRGHDIEKNDLEELVEEIEKKGLTSVQLALSKSLDYVNTDLGSLSPGLAHYVGSTFQKHGIQIAVLGCYINMIHPDKVERRKGLERFKEHIRYARDFGCSIVGTETGNVNAEIFYTTENFKEEPFQEVVESVRELVEEAEKFGVIVGIEAGVNHPIYSSKVMRRLLDCVNSNNLQVIFDPVNLLTIDNYKKQDEIFEEAFNLFGDRMVILHAKDFIVENQMLKPAAVGKGLLNYDLVMKLIKEKKPFINILMEDTQEPFIDESIVFLREKYNQG